MAFIDKRATENRAAFVIVVAVLQSFAIYGIITGFAGDFIRERIVPNLPTREYPQEVPKPDVTPPPPEKERTQSRRVETPEELSGLTAKIPDDTILGGDNPPFGELPPVEWPQFGGEKQYFEPVVAKPRNDPANWVSTNDYPTRDIRQGNEGTSRFLLNVSAQGKVMGCRITQSSGHHGLDAATCKSVARRARFEPATDANGARIASTYSGSIRWVIPE